MCVIRCPYSKYKINNITAPPPPPPPPLPTFVKGGNWIFELNEIWGELKFFKIKGDEKEEGRGIFEIFIGGKNTGDETSNREQNFRMNLKMFS